MSTTMQAFVLLGDDLKQKEYLGTFKKEKNVSSYLITEFLEGFKILDARLLQKKLSVKLHADEVRLITIKSPTLDSQNALLKTLEELEPNTYIFFLCLQKEELLPTILSRASVIDMGVIKQEANEQIITILKDEKLTQDHLVKILDYISSLPTEEEIEMVILSARIALLQSLKKKNKEIVLSFLKHLTVLYSFSQTNNINKKMVIETAILASNMTKTRPIRFWSLTS